MLLRLPSVPSDLVFRQMRMFQEHVACEEAA